MATRPRRIASGRAILADGPAAVNSPAATGPALGAVSRPGQRKKRRRQLHGAAWHSRQRVVYLNGELKVAASTAQRIAADADVPTAPDGYAHTCGKVARMQVGKAGLRLADQLKKLFP